METPTLAPPKADAADQNQHADQQPHALKRPVVLVGRIALGEQSDGHDELDDLGGTVANREHSVEEHFSANGLSKMAHGTFIVAGVWGGALAGRRVNLRWVLRESSLSAITIVMQRESRTGKHSPMWSARIGVAFVASTLAPVVSAYHVDTHWYLTYAIARDAGFTALQSERIAIANQLCDEHPFLEPQQLLAQALAVSGDVRAGAEMQVPRVRYHAFFADWDERLASDLVGKSESEQALIRAKSVILQGNRLLASCRQLDNPGPVLHFLQDFFSHYGYGSYWGHWNPKDAFTSSKLPFGGITDALGFEPRLQSVSPFTFPNKGRDDAMLQESLLLLKRWNDPADNFRHPLEAHNPNLVILDGPKRALNLLSRLKKELTVSTEPAFPLPKHEPEENHVKQCFEDVLRLYDTGSFPMRKPLSREDAAKAYRFPATFGEAGDKQTKIVEGLNIHSKVNIKLNNEALQAKSIVFSYPDTGQNKTKREVSLTSLGRSPIKLPVGKCRIKLNGRSHFEMDREFSGTEETLYLGTVAKWEASTIKKNGHFEGTLWIAAPSLPNIGSYEPWQGMLKKADAMDGPASNRFLTSEMPKVISRYQEWIKSALHLKVNGVSVPVSRFTGTGDAAAAWFYVLFRDQALPEHAPTWFYDVVVWESDFAGDKVTSVELTIGSETLIVPKRE